MEDYSEVYFLLCKAKHILTKRQAECLFFAREGFNNRDISKRLFIAESTVKKTFEDMFTRLDVNSRIQVLNFIHLELFNIISDFLSKKYNITILEILKYY